MYLHIIDAWRALTAKLVPRAEETNNTNVDGLAPDPVATQGDVPLAIPVNRLED
jgi:hypothetical protein